MKLNYTCKHKQKHLFLWNIQEITHKHFFLQLRMMRFNSSLLLANHNVVLHKITTSVPGLPTLFASISSPVTMGLLCPIFYFELPSWKQSGFVPRMLKSDRSVFEKCHLADDNGSSVSCAWSCAVVIICTGTDFLFIVHYVKPMEKFSGTSLFFFG